MELLEVILAVGLWVVFALLGRRKRAARSAAPPDEPGWLEVDEEASSGEGSGQPAPIDFRELIRRLRDGWMPAEPPEESSPQVRAVPPEPPPPTPPTPPPVAYEEPDLETSPAPRRRRSALASGLLRDLSSTGGSLARAVLLREVLGPPVALRGSDDTDRAGTERWAG